jgi:hypothetical protein
MSRSESPATDKNASPALQKLEQDRYRELGHVVTASRHVILSVTRTRWFESGDRMKSVNELLELFTRQAELEKAMRQPGGARVTEEQELLAVKRKLAKLPEAMGIALTSAMGPPETAKSDCGIDG